LDTFSGSDRNDTLPDDADLREFPPPCPICRTRMALTERVETVYLLVCGGCEATLRVPLRALKEWSL